MQRIQIGVASLNQTPLDWAGNKQRIKQVIAEAHAQKVAILCLPELCVTGYGCEDMYFSKEVCETAAEVTHELASSSNGMAICVGLPVRHNDRLYNAMAWLVGGQVVALVCKQHLANDGIHYEGRWFTPWPTGAVEPLSIGDKLVPAGDVLLQCGGVGIGTEICRDSWVSNRPAPNLVSRGAQVLLNPSASHFAFEKTDIRKRLVLAASRLGVAAGFCNLLGNESGRSIFDGDTMIAVNGEYRAIGPRFSYADHHLLTAVVEVDPARRCEPIGTVVARQGCLPIEQNPTPPASAEQLYAEHSPWETSSFRKEEEFSRATPLALWDYLRKSRSKGLVLSLSGGADSSAVALLVHLMAWRVCDELGVKAAGERLAAIDSNSGPPESAAELVGRLFSCVYQSTENSGEVTRHAAESIARFVGAQFLNWSVDPMVKHYIDAVSEAVDRPLTWEADDVALQNIQARARGPAVWLLANLRNALLLATSNRSEAAVGYATMDGDTCGGLSPIAGIDKAFLRHWLRWLESTGPEGHGASPELSVVNDQEPTAELRPPSANQTDESDLMPYQVLDAIERAAVRDKLLPVSVYREMRQQFPDYSANQVGRWVERFFQLWCRNQWKRERYAPSFHLDDKNLDPKTWCRFPILNSGFDQELAELRELLATE